MDEMVRGFIAELNLTSDVKNYSNLVNKIAAYFEGNQKFDIANDIRFKAKYLPNKFSSVSTSENMERSKLNVLTVLNQVLLKEETSGGSVQYLKSYLENFSCFLEVLKEKIPNKRATLNVDELAKLAINNEYDLQHFLYAGIKPLFPDARVEVTGDTGFAAVRSDIWIPSIRAVVEAKCTRTNMTAKKLTEEIEADIVHYNAEYIFFYIYDKFKIINNKQAFEDTYNMTFNKKYVQVMIQQPSYM